MSIESSSLLWKIKRLKSMSMFEIYIRSKRAIELKLFGIKSKFKLVDHLISSNESFLLETQIDVTKHQLSISKIITEADNYLIHKWLFFGAVDVKEEWINWHYDPVNKKTAPEIYAFSINHRKYDEVGNIKLIWEKNRHHHLTVLSLAYYLTGDEKYAKEVVGQIKHWIQENPFLIGVNWTHPLENAIRLISWVYCERFLRGSDCYEDLFNKTSIFWSSVYEHQKFISKTYTIGSSANNHLIGEMAGLFISSVNWPFFSESNNWLRFSQKMLEKEIKSQSFESGVNKEMAFAYQIFVFEFYLLSYIEALHHKVSFKRKFSELLIRNAQVISDITKNNQGEPNYGDGDEGMAIQLQDLMGNRISWLMEVMQSLFPDLELYYMLNTLPAEVLGYPSINKNIPSDLKSIGFKGAGIYILNQKNNDINVSILFKAGPFGYKSIAAHSHADSLSFTLNVNGIPLFVDPGTYCYHTDLQFRRYFRSTKAHNTLSIDNLDQSEQLGPFLWGKKAQTFVKKFSLSDNYIKAYHTGYKHIPGIHTREIKLGDKLKISDEITGKGQHILDFRFHLHPDVRIIEKKKKTLLLSNKNIELVIKLEADYDLHIYNGETEGGWFSPRFNVKVPTTTLSYQKRLSLPTKQIFSIEFKIL